VLGGQKVWTSGAQFADVGYVIARTDPDAPRQRAFTAFLVPMDAPGVEVRPLRQMTGGTSFNEVFFDEVRIPDSARLGEEGGGWAAMMTTLAFERANAADGLGFGGTELVDRLLLTARHLGRDTDPVIRQRIAELYSRNRMRNWVADRAEAKIDAAITRLTDADPKVRLAAESELREFRELAYPMLKRAAAGTSSIDRSLQATLLVKWLEEKVGPEKLKIRDQDVIQAAEFTIAGKIEAPSVTGCTPYFGDVTVQVAEVRSIRFLAGPGAETELTIDAARYAAMAQDVWLDTEVDLAEGAAIEISAAGQVDLWPQGGNYKVGPDAQPRQGNSPDGNPAGILLGRIGERGKAFHIGSKFRGSLSESGRLYLRIACSPWNNASTGGYAVKIDPNADLDETPAVVAPAPKKKNKALPKGQFK